MKRLFLAIALPEQILEEIDELLYELPGVKWVERENLHITLKFIGEVNGSMFRDIKDSLKEIKYKQFQISLSGLGYFDNKTMPLWIGINDKQNLKNLFLKIENNLSTIGVSRENRKFKAHLTLGRIKNYSHDDFTSFMARFSLFRSDRFNVDSFHLVSSILSPKGPSYSLEASYKLFPG